VSIEIRSVSRRFGEFTALEDVHLTIADGELVALLGPSGSGKTTLLRVIAGLERPDTGRLLFDGIDAADRAVQARQVGFVFQHYALFRHMNVFENVAFGLRVRPRRVRGTQEDIRARVTKLLRLVQMEVLADRLPSQLSGGQRQRVALARALAVEPRVLLLDEPFGALDARVRQELRRWLRRLHDDLHVTSVFVTHDQEEALELADRVVVMNEGRIEQVGTPSEVYQCPASPFVYQFLGDVNLFQGRLQDGRVHVGSLQVPLDSRESRADGRAMIGVRPHELTIESSGDGADGFHARVTHVNAAGSLVKVQLLASWGDTVRVEMPEARYRTLALRRDEEVFVRVDRERLYVAAV
jgi:sulfate transport system ATP-binding protein